MKNRLLEYSILRGKSEESDEKLEGKIGPVMEVHMDANAALSQSGKFSANGLRCMVCQKLIIQHLQKQKFAMAFSIDL